METGKVISGVVAIGVVAAFAFGKGSYFNPGSYTNNSNVGRFTTTATPSQYAGFFGAGSSKLEEDIPYAGFFGAGSSKLEEPVLPGSFSNARPSAGFLSMSSPIQEDLYGPDRPDRYVPWQLRG